MNTSIGIIIIEVSIVVGLILGAIFGAIYLIYAVYVSKKHTSETKVNKAIAFFSVFAISGFFTTIISLVIIGLYMNQTTP